MTTVVQPDALVAVTSMSDPPVPSSATGAICAKPRCIRPARPSGCFCSGSFWNLFGKRGRLQRHARDGGS